MINSTLTIAYKNVLKESQLVDSGKLLNSISVDLSVSANDIIVNIKSLDYLKYLVKENNLTNKFINKSEFENEIGNLYLPIIEKAINDTLDGQQPSVLNPQIIILYNGK